MGGGSAWSLTGPSTWQRGRRGARQGDCGGAGGAWCVQWPTSSALALALSATPNDRGCSRCTQKIMNKRRLRAPGRRAVRAVTGRETAESVIFGAVAPCTGGVRAVSGPGRVSGRSARRLGRAGCRRGGGEGPGRLAGFGRGTVLEGLPITVPEGAVRPMSCPQHRQACHPLPRALRVRIALA